MLDSKILFEMLDTGKVKMALKISVESIEGERYAQAIVAGRHNHAADRPIHYGGSDLGPGPYSYLLAALGS